MPKARMILGDCQTVLDELIAEECKFDCCITSPPFWPSGCDIVSIGMEPTQDEYIGHLVSVFAKVGQMLTDGASLWVQSGESSKSPAKYGTPWMFAAAMQNAGWVLHPECIWFRALDKYDFIFHFSKSDHYWHTENMRRKVIFADYATYPGYSWGMFPQEIVEYILKGSCKPSGHVLDPFAGSGMAGLVAQSMVRKFTGIEMDESSYMIAASRLGCKGEADEA